MSQNSGLELNFALLPFLPFSGQRALLSFIFNELSKFQLNQCNIRQMVFKLLQHGYGFPLIYTHLLAGQPPRYSAHKATCTRPATPDVSRCIFQEVNHPDTPPTRPPALGHVHRMSRASLLPHRKSRHNPPILLTTLVWVSPTLAFKAHIYM